MVSTSENTRTNMSCRIRVGRLGYMGDKRTKHFSRETCDRGSQSPAYCALTTGAHASLPIPASIPASTVHQPETKPPTAWYYKLHHGQGRNTQNPSERTRVQTCPMLAGHVLPVSLFFFFRVPRHHLRVLGIEAKAQVIPFLRQ